MTTTTWTVSNKTDTTVRVAIDPVPTTVYTNCMAMRRTSALTCAISAVDRSNRHGLRNVKPNESGIFKLPSDHVAILTTSDGGGVLGLGGLAVPLVSQGNTYYISVDTSTHLVTIDKARKRLPAWVVVLLVALGLVGVGVAIGAVVVIRRRRAGKSVSK